MSLGALQIGPIRPSGGGGTTIPTSARVPFLASCPTGWTQDATLDGTMLLATTAGHGDVGQTGGANAVTPAGSNSTPSFSGNAVTSSAVSAGTPAGSVTAPTFTGDAVASTAVSGGTPTGTVTQPTLTMNSYTPAGTNGTVSFTPAGTNGTSATTATGTVAWPAGVPAFTGQAFSSVINHTHTINITDPGHGRLAQGGTTAATTGTHIMTSTATGGSARATADGASTTAITAASVNPAGGVASITPAGTNAWPAGVPTFAGSSSTVSAQTFTGSSGTVSAQPFSGASATLTGTVSQPSFSGSALGTHQHTTTATGTNSTPAFSGSALGTHAHATTATGSVSTPLFTGDQFDNRSAYTKVIWCRVTSSEPAPVAAVWQFLSFGLIAGLALALFLRKP